MKITNFKDTPDTATTEQLASLYTKIFGENPNQKFYDRLRTMPKIYGLLAWDERGEPVAYKIGYQKGETSTFYSWIGGVLPAFRNRGLARRLMDLQHEHCRVAGFEKIETKTMNRWRAMLILNLKNGFDIVEILPHADGNLRIVLQKLL